MERLVALFNAEPLERARAFVKALVDRVAFAVESLCVALAALLLLVFGVCRFHYPTLAHELGNFWSHYAKASPVAREPVDHFMVGALILLSLVIAAIRYPKAKRAFDPLAWGARQ